MFSRFEWMMASRYLRPRRQDGFVSVIAMFSLLGIALGVATLIIVMSVMNGFREELMKRILGLNGHLSLYSDSVSLTDYDAVAARVAEVPGVALVAPVVEGQVMATANTVARGAVVRGMRAEDLRRRAIIADNVVGGSLDAFAGDDAVVVGSRLAERMGLAIGDDITLISPQGNVTVFGTVPTVRNYKVVA
ncbi:MAG: ABC transporter permease, partial [Rhodospirillales bacterium]|nr:ABC transporter permease [Rhodospirillales bacterium]